MTAGSSPQGLVERDLMVRARDGVGLATDVYRPPGAGRFPVLLCEGLLRLRYRDGWERPSRLTPGEVYAIAIELFPIGNRFARGHRLRLDISSSNFPHFDVNPNSGEPEGAMEQPRIAINRVFVDRERPSHLVLPVIA
jgi:uncharacterized protein